MITASLPTTSIKDRITNWFTKRKRQNTPTSPPTEPIKTLQILERKIKILKSYAAFHSNAYVKITNHIEAEELILAKEKAKTLPRRHDTQTTKLRTGYFHPKALTKHPHTQPQQQARTREITSCGNKNEPRFRTKEDEERFHQKLHELKTMLAKQKERTLKRQRLITEEALAKIEEREKEELKQIAMEEQKQLERFKLLHQGAHPDDDIQPRSRQPLSIQAAIQFSNQHNMDIKNSNCYLYTVL